MGNVTASGQDTQVADTSDNLISLQTQLVDCVLLSKNRDATVSRQLFVLYRLTLRTELATKHRARAWTDAERSMVRAVLFTSRALPITC